MIPGRYNFGTNISDEWLASGDASRLLAGASAFTLAATAGWLAGVQVQDTGVLSRVLWGIFGVLLPISVFFLWGGMWSYWMRCDPSSRLARRIWFAILLIGFWYGSILYYAFVYLRTRRRAVPNTIRGEEG
jgi:hypothetical protein